MYNPNKHDPPDWRIVVYAETPQAGGYWIGLPNGMTSARAAAYLGNGKKEPLLGEYFRIATAPGMFMSRAEVCFLLAEAKFRGLLTFGPRNCPGLLRNGSSGIVPGSMPPNY
jgi:hypothetical protein